MEQNGASPGALEGPGIYDVVGVGFGPANLALVVAIQDETDRQAGRPLRHLFLDRKESWSWHPGMMLAGTQVQVPFLKDLVTLHNPRSRFTFLNYLMEKGRLHEFVNLRSFFPSRVEFNDYFAWVAGQLAASVRYGREVEAVLPVAVDGNGKVEALKVVSRALATGEREELVARNLVVATGGAPRAPSGSCPSARVCHSGDLLCWLAERFPDADAPYRFAVVGSGQSAAEILFHLLTTYRNAEVALAMRRFAFKPLDDSSFINELFFPENVDFFYGLQEEQKRSLLSMHPDLDRSVVDSSLIRALYELLYREKVAGRDRSRILRMTELVEVASGEAAATLRLRRLLDGAEQTLETDGVVLATGYSRDGLGDLLRGVAPYLETNGSGSFHVERSYRIAKRDGFVPDIYLQGFCEQSHGITDPLLSLLPIRAQEILASLRRGTGLPPAGAAPSPT